MNPPLTGKITKGCVLLTAMTVLLCAPARAEEKPCCDPKALIQGPCNYCQTKRDFYLQKCEEYGRLGEQDRIDNEYFRDWSVYYCTRAQMEDK
jgi:hypothetical protein